MGTHLKYIVLFGWMAMLVACNNGTSQNRGPIILGDSSMIVTENDPAKLQDLVTDLSPTIQSSEPKDTTPEQKAPAKAPDTAATPAPQPIKTPLTAILKAAPQSSLSGTGLKADFGTVSVLIPNINAKQSGKPNLTHANGAVYMFGSGAINGNIIKTTANVTKVSQRYQTLVVLKNELGVLPLESLSVTTSWETLPGANNTYKITGLDERSLKYPDADREDIRDAVTKAVRRRHMSRKKQQEWERSVRNVRSANQKPLNVMLRSVMWKIDGKDADGKPFSKQIRVDMPI